MSLNVVEVEFDLVKKHDFFLNKSYPLKKGVTIIVNSERGLQFGKIVNIYDDVDNFSELNLYDIVRVASKSDYQQHLNNLKSIGSGIKICKDLVKKHKLSMTILDGSYNFDRTQLLFRFVADERVDFRNLAKELGSIFKTRIELRQIGIRDKSKEVGGIGPCGRILCCTSFLNSFDSVTISMAKNQGVSLNPTKINGVCGRLLCCLKYENDVYSYNKKDLPRIGSKVSISNKQGKVTFVNILKKEYTVIFNDGSKSVIKNN